MNTRQSIQDYFGRLSDKRDWSTLLANEINFTSHTSPVKRVEGKTPYLEATKRFFASIVSVNLQELLVDGEKACALTRYELRAPDGAVFASEVAEVFHVRGGQIVSLQIYFDSAPFPK